MGKQLMSRKNLPVFFLVALVTRAAALAQTYEGVEVVRPALIADATAILPGQKFTAGLHLRMAPGWHTYWHYPGDSGLAPKIEWNLPAGFSAGAIQWPLPGKIVEPGDIVTYGYKDEVLLLVEISVPQQIAEREVTLKAKASWLVCEQICIPGSAHLSLTLPVASESAVANRRLFEKYRALLPKVGLPPPFHYQWKSKPGLAVLEITGAKSGKLDFFPLPPAGSSIEHPQINTGEIRIPVTTGAPDQLSGVVVLGEGRERNGWFIASESSSAPPLASGGGVSIFGLKGTTRDLLRNLFFGFLGGFILNLMPCVLPVIALKIFGFIQQAGQSQAKIFRLGLAFIAGIFVWFLGLAALVVGFKAAGHELNWAFQFQSPWFLAVMALIVLVFALNLLGVFEVVLPAGANRAAARHRLARGLPRRVSARHVRHGARHAVHRAVPRDGARVRLRTAARARVCDVRQHRRRDEPAVFSPHRPSRLAAAAAEAGNVDGARETMHGPAAARHRGVAGMGAFPAAAWRGPRAVRTATRCGIAKRAHRVCGFHRGVVRELQGQ